MEKVLKDMFDQTAFYDARELTEVLLVKEYNISFSQNTFFKLRKNKVNYHALLQITGYKQNDVITLLVM